MLIRLDPMVRVLLIILDRGLKLCELLLGKVTLSNIHLPTWDF